MKLVLALLLTLLVHVSIAGPKKETALRVLNVEVDAFKLVYSANVVENVKIKIYDYENRLIHTEYVGRTDGFILPLNFKNAGNGNFTIKVETPNETLVEHVTLRKSSLAVNSDIQFTPMENKVLVNSAVDNNDPMRLVIKDNTNRTIYSESLKNGNFNKVFRFENVEGGWAEFYLYQNGKLLKRKVVSI